MERGVWPEPGDWRHTAQPRAGDEGASIHMMPTVNFTP